MHFIKEQGNQIMILFRYKWLNLLAKVYTSLKSICLRQPPDFWMIQQMWYNKYSGLNMLFLGDLVPTKCTTWRASFLTINKSFENLLEARHSLWKSNEKILSCELTSFTLAQIYKHCWCILYVTLLLRQI